MTLLLPGLKLKGKKDIDASSSISARLDATVNRMRPIAKRTMRIGAEPPPPNWLGLPETIDTQIEIMLTVEMRIVWPENEDLPPKLEYVSVEFGTPESRLAEQQALLELLGRRRS